MGLRVRVRVRVTVRVRDRDRVRGTFMHVFSMRMSTAAYSAKSTISFCCSC